MRQCLEQFECQTSGKGLYPITHDVIRFVAGSNIATGLLTVFCRHTSASLVMQENADPDVPLDIAEYFERMVPEGMDWLRHTLEGPDDMPAHIRAALSGNSLAIPVANGSPVLGTWQGVFLFEHRRAPHNRQIVLHLLGE